MNRTLLKTIGLLSLSGILWSCGSGDSSEDKFDTIAKSDSSGMLNSASDELVNQVIKSIPPPVEMESIIEKSGAAYNSALLNAVDNASRYNTNYLKALNLGVYGADLGYINIYNHKEDALSYLNAVIKLAEDLKVGQFFDFETIKRMANNSSNLDSMLNITTSNFEKMNNYLQENKRSNLSMYMLTGGWVEALHVSSQVALTEKSQPLFEKVGEQKVVLDQIILLLSFYKHDPNAVTLSKDLDKLKKIFEQIKVETVYAEPTMEIVNGVPTVKDNSKTLIIVTEEQVKQIADLAGEIRSKIIS